MRRKYVVLKSDSIEDLQKEVNVYLRTYKPGYGFVWELQGGISTVFNPNNGRVFYLQAVYRKEMARGY